MDPTALATALLSMRSAGTRQSIQNTIIKQQLDFQKQAVTILDPIPAAAAPGTGTLVDRLA